MSVDNEIRINTGEVSNTGVETKKSGNDYENLIVEFAGHCTKIRSGWTFPEAFDFEDKALILKGHLEEAAEDVIKAGTGLINVADEFQSTSSSNRGLIQNS